jgi:hypothetical protein
MAFVYVRVSISHATKERVNFGDLVNLGREESLRLSTTSTLEKTCCIAGPKQILFFYLLPADVVSNSTVQVYCLQW